MDETILQFLKRSRAALVPGPPDGTFDTGFCACIAAVERFLARLNAGAVRTVRASYMDMTPVYRQAFLVLLLEQVPIVGAAAALPHLHAAFAAYRLHDFLHLLRVTGISHGAFSNWVKRLSTEEKYLRTRRVDDGPVAAELRAALADLVTRCDGTEGVRTDGSNMDTTRAHAALGHFKVEEGV